MHNYKEMKIWQKSRTLVNQVYGLSQRFPKEENYGLTSQLRRAVISIPSNIAEGAGRNSDKEFARFIDISRGSLFEVETILILSADLNYVAETDLQPVFSSISEISRMINGFKNHLV